MVVELRRDGDMFTCELSREYLDGIGIDLDDFLHSIDLQQPDTRLLDKLVNEVSIAITNTFDVHFIEGEPMVVTFDGPVGGDFINVHVGVGDEVVSEQRELMEAMYGEDSIISRNSLDGTSEVVMEKEPQEYHVGNINKRFGYTYGDAILSVLVEFRDIEDVIAVSKHFGEGDTPGSLMTYYEGRYIVEVGVCLDELGEALGSDLIDPEDLTYEHMLEMVREYNPEDYDMVLARGLTDREIEDIRDRYAEYVYDISTMSDEKLFTIALTDLERIASIMCEYGNLSGISPYVLEEYGKHVIEGDVFGELNANFN